MPTTRYWEMQKRITQLRKRMLPHKFSSTGTYSERVHSHAAAYRLLAHAEFEAYLEDATITLATNRVNLWLNERKPSVTLASLIAYHDTPCKPPSSILIPPQKPSAMFDERLRAALTSFQYNVRKYNHGIKEDNVLKLVLPIGLSPDALNIVWLSDLTDWAGDRGQVAHQPLMRLKSAIDPAREHATVKGLLEGFKSLDAKISAIP